jgi:hypothetical protein
MLGRMLLVALFTLLPLAAQPKSTGEALDAFLLPKNADKAWAVCQTAFKRGAFAPRSIHLLTGDPALLRSAATSATVPELGLTYRAMADIMPLMGRCFKGDDRFSKLDTPSAWWHKLTPAPKGSKFCADVTELFDVSALRLYWLYYERYAVVGERDVQLTGKDINIRSIIGPYNQPLVDTKYFQMVANFLGSRDGMAWLQRQASAPRQGQSARDIKHLNELIVARSTNSDAIAAAMARAMISNHVEYVRAAIPKTE